MTDEIIARAMISGPEADGTADLLRTSSGPTLRLLDFHFASGAPDLRVYLSPSSDGEVNAPGTIDLGRMSQFSGRAELHIPSDARPETFRTVVVYCREFSVEFGRGILVPRRTRRKL